MKKIIKKYRLYLVWILIFMIYLLFMSILGYSGIIRLSLISKINLFVMSLFTLLMGIIKGKKASKKGYLEGLKFGGIIVLILFIFNIIFYRAINIYLFLYYILILVSSIIGSMIGINLHR